MAKKTGSGVSTAIAALILAAGAAGLCGCGKVGTLDQPAPLYGEKAKADYQARKEAAAAAKAKPTAQPDVIHPDRPYDPEADPSPTRSLPVPGQPTLPNAPPPPGVLPDPLASPNNPGPG
jgi:hypothetical protein